MKFKKGILDYIQEEHTKVCVGGDFSPHGLLPQHNGETIKIKIDEFCHNLLDIWVVSCYNDGVQQLGD
jgi:hypothetical protein